MGYSWRKDHEEKRKNKDLAHGRQKTLEDHGYEQNRRGRAEPIKEKEPKKSKQTRFKHPNARDYEK